MKTAVKNRYFHLFSSDSFYSIFFFCLLANSISTSEISAKGAYKHDIGLTNKVLF